MISCDETTFDLIYTFIEFLCPFNLTIIFIKSNLIWESIQSEEIEEKDSLSFSLSLSLFLTNSLLSPAFSANLSFKVLI